MVSEISEAIAKMLRHIGCFRASPSVPVPSSEARRRKLKNFKAV